MERRGDGAGLCAEAVRLGRLLTGLMPDEPEAAGLLALMLLVESRRPARHGEHGELVPLPEQDRGRWDGDLIAEGQDLVRRCLRRISAIARVKFALAPILEVIDVKVRHAIAGER